MLALVLPLTLWYSGAPLPAAIAGILAYRILSLLLPLQFSLAALPSMRRLGGERQEQAPGIAEAPAQEPALQRGDARDGTS